MLALLSFHLSYFLVLVVVAVAWICNRAKSMLSCRFCSPNMSSWIVLLYKVYWHSAKCQPKFVEMVWAQKCSYADSKCFPTEMLSLLGSEYGSSFVLVMNTAKEKEITCERQVAKGGDTWVIVQDLQLHRRWIISLHEGCDIFKGAAEAFGRRQNK